MTTLHDIPVTGKDGAETTLADHRGKVMLIVNTASKCGFTPQFEGLEKLYQTYRDRGFVVLGFPCNQFGQQDPGDQAEIEHFCQVNYGVSFPIYRKIDVNGRHAAPLFSHLKDRAPGLLGSKGIKWNFTKFLVSADGEKVTRYGPRTRPEALAGDIEQQL